MKSAVCLIAVLLLAAIDLRAGISDFTDRGSTDFDTAMQLLDPYGTWAKADNLWAFTPFNHMVPYTSGRWLYTEYGWYWQGTAPTSWATEHYGFWKRGEDRIWRWFPGPTWLPQIVEIRTTSTHIGWRCAEVDTNGSFVEAPADRYAMVEEWSFVTRAQFTRPIVPSELASPAVATSLLDDSSDSMHSYFTYRAITRPGPHPADVLALNPKGGMFPPTVGTGLPTPSPSAAPTKSLPRTATNSTAGAAAGPVDDNGAPADLRQAPYWITMSLPTYWTRPPAEAQPNQIYLYQPNFYQDEDGIARRISLWIDPASRKTKVSLGALLGEHSRTPRAPLPAGNGAPAVPVPPAPNSAFQSPFDESFHHGTADGATPSASTKSPAAQAPSGLVSPTNTAPNPGP